MKEKIEELEAENSKMLETLLKHSKERGNSTLNIEPTSLKLSSDFGGPSEPNSCRNSVIMAKTGQPGSARASPLKKFFPSIKGSVSTRNHNQNRILPLRVK